MTIEINEREHSSDAELPGIVLLLVLVAVLTVVCWLSL